MDAAHRQLERDLPMIHASPMSALGPLLQVPGTELRRKRPRLTNRLSLSDEYESESLQARAPDLMDFLAERHEGKKELEQQNLTLQANQQTLQQRLKTAQEALEEQKGMNAALKAERDSTRAEGQRLRNELESQLKKEIGRTSSANSELRRAEAKRTAAQATAEAAERGSRTLEARLQADSSRSQQQIQQLQTQMLEDRQTAASNLMQYKRQLQNEEANSQANLEKLREQKEVCRRVAQQLEEALQDAAAAKARSKALELQHAEQQKAVQAAAAPASGDHHDTVTQNLREELRAQEREIAEARRIRSQAGSLSMLREQLVAEEAKLKRAELELLEMREVQARAAGMEHQLQLWQAATEARLPEQLTQLVVDLQRQCLGAKEQLGQKDAQLAAAKGETTNAEDASAKLRADVDDLQQTLARNAATSATLERRVQLGVQEREGLLKLLESYREEASRDPSVQGDQSNSQGVHVKALEQENAVLRSHLEQLETDLARVKSGAEQQVSALQARAAEAEAQTGRLEAEAESLGSQVADLQEKLGRGHYNAETTRVVHLIHNPEAELLKEQQQSKIAELQVQNEALQAELKKLEGAPAFGKPSQAAAWARSVAAAEASVMQLKVADLERKNRRLTEVFTRQVGHFREACLSLFGYRIDMVSEPSRTGAAPTTFVLRPQQSDGSHVELVFKLDSNGHMELVPNDYTARKLHTEVQTFITRFNSIPAFTANLTMELFQRQTSC